MPVPIEEHLIGLADFKVALANHVEMLCGHFDTQSVKIVPTPELSLAARLTLTAIALVRVLNEERDDWVEDAMATLGETQRGEDFIGKHRAIVREFLALAYETETKRLMRHVETTIVEEITRRARNDDGEPG